MLAKKLIIILALAFPLAGHGNGQVRRLRALKIGDGGQAVLASLNGPSGIAVDADGNLFIADTLHYRVRRVDARTGIITTVAGGGTVETNDGGPATRAGLKYPTDVAVDASGHLFIADFSAGRIRRVDARTGIITTVAGNSDPGCHSIDPPMTGVIATSTCLESPEGIALDAIGNLFISDRRHRVYRVEATSGLLTTYAGGGSEEIGDGGPATESRLSFPQGLCFDGQGNLFIADYQHCRIRRVDVKKQEIETAGGSDADEAPTKAGPARETHLCYPSSVVIDAAGNLYFDEGSGGRIWRIDARMQTVSRFAGSALRGFGGDGGPALRARLYNPSGLALDRQGDLYVSDFVTNRVRRIDARTGLITTVAGNGHPHRIDVLLLIGVGSSLSK